MSASAKAAKPPASARSETGRRTADPPAGGLLDPFAADRDASDAANAAALAAAQARQVRAEVEARRVEQRSAAMRIELGKLDVDELCRTARDTAGGIARAVVDGADPVKAHVSHLLAGERARKLGELAAGYARTVGEPEPELRLAGVAGLGVGGVSFAAGKPTGATSTGAEMTLFRGIADGVRRKIDAEVAEIKARVQTATDAGLPAREPDTRSPRERALDELAERQTRERARCERAREQSYVLHVEAQRRRGYQPVPFPRWVYPGGIDEAGMGQADRDLYGLDDTRGYST